MSTHEKGHGVKAGTGKAEAELDEKKHFAEKGSLCIIHTICWGTRSERDFKSGAQSMSEASNQEQLSRKMMALFLIGGSLGAIIMSWIAYAAMIGRAL